VPKRAQSYRLRLFAVARPPIYLRYPFIADRSIRPHQEYSKLAQYLARLLPNFMMASTCYTHGGGDGVETVSPSTI